MPDYHENFSVHISEDDSEINLPRKMYENSIILKSCCDVNLTSSEKENLCSFRIILNIFSVVVTV